MVPVSVSKNRLFLILGIVTFTSMLVSYFGARYGGVSREIVFALIALSFAYSFCAFLMAVDASLPNDRALVFAKAHPWARRLVLVFLFLVLTAIYYRLAFFIGSSGRGLSDQLHVVYVSNRLVPIALGFCFFVLAVGQWRSGSLGRYNYLVLPLYVIAGVVSILVGYGGH